MADQVAAGSVIPGAQPDEGRKPGQKMELTRLKSILNRELDQALGTEGGKLSQERKRALEYYDGEPFGNEIEGRSQVVMMTLMEAVEWVLPALLRIFTASDKICDFEPNREQDEAAAEQASQYVSYIFYRDNDGFMLLHDWFKDALIQPGAGWVKVYWDNQEYQEVNDYRGLTEDEYKALKTPDVQVLSERSYPAPMPGGIDEDAPDPQAAGQMLYDCTLLHIRTEGRVKLENVPPEEMLVSRRAKRGVRWPFTCHRRQRVFSDLVEEGYDAETLRTVPSYDAPEYNSERVERYEDEDDYPYQTERTDEAQRPVWVEESYLRVDYDGTGTAQLQKIVTAGNGQVILTKNGKPDIERVDDIPFVAITPVPMPHKLMGKSLYTVLQDIQLIKSTLARQILDNLYLSNNPRVIVEDGAANENTYDDILTSRPGGLIRAAKAAGIVPHETPFVAAQAMEIVEYIDATAETRTGISRRNQTIDANAINQSSSGLQESLMQQAAAQRVELIARIFAESGIKELVRIILGYVVRYQQHERVIRLTGKWVPMDPRQWRSSMDVTVSVGLGTGNRDQIGMHLKEILEAQMNILMGAAKAGPQAAQYAKLVSPKNMYDVLQRATENAGFKEDFFTDPTAPPDPSQPPPPPQPPDPEMVKAQTQMQLEQQKVQLASANDNARLQADLAAQKAKAELDAQLARERAQLDAQLSQQKLQHEMELERMRFQADAALKQQELAHKAAQGAFAPSPAPAVA